MDDHRNPSSPPLQAESESGGKRNPYPDSCRPDGGVLDNKVSIVEWEH